LHHPAVAGAAPDQPGPAVNRQRPGLPRPLSVAASLALLAQVGLTGAPALAVLYGAALWDLALGCALLVRLRPVLIGALQLATMVTFALIIAVFLPKAWLHPFGR
jgi:DoxX-like family